MTWRPDRFELRFYTRLERVLHAVARRRELAESRRMSAAVTRPPRHDGRGSGAVADRRRRGGRSYATATAAPTLACGRP